MDSDFHQKSYMDIAVDTLNYSRNNKSLKIFAYVILDNHLHMEVTGDNLPKIIKEFKTYTAREIIKQAKQEEKGWLLSQLKYHRYEHKTESGYRVWQEGFQPKMINQKRCYCKR